MTHGIQAKTQEFNDQKHKEMVRTARQKGIPVPSACDSITIEQLDKIAAQKTTQKKYILRKNK